MKHGQKIKKKCTFALMEAGFASSAPLSAVIPHMAHDACFTFSGKEKDPETGLSYFGARYYDADLTTGWLSVDPMADKCPSISPYACCAWNPVKLVDPDGRDTTISINLQTGNILFQGCDEDRNGTSVTIYNDEKFIESYSCTGDVGISVCSQRSTLYFSKSSEAEIIYNKIIGKNSGHQESGVEWNLYIQKDGSGDLVTSQKSDFINISGLENKYSFNTTISMHHYHPNLNGYTVWFPSEKDQAYAKSLNGVPCFLNFNGQEYQFDNIVRKYGVIKNQNFFKKNCLPLNINTY